MEILRDDLNASTAELRRVRDNTNKAISDAQAQNQREIQRVSALHQQKEDALQRQLGNLSGELKNSIVSHRKEMQVQSKKFYDELEKQSAEFHETLEQELQEQSTEFYEALDNQNVNLTKKIERVADWTRNELQKQNDKFDKITQKQQKQIDATRKDVDGIINRLRDDDERAALLEKELSQIIKVLDKEIPHAKFAPGKMEELKNDYVKVCKSGYSAASKVAILHGVLSGLMKLEEEVMIAQQKFDALHAMVLQAARTLLETMQNNRENIYFTDENDKIRKKFDGTDAQVEIDYWMRGEYSKLENRATELKNQLENNKTSLSEDDIKTILDNTLTIQLEQNKMVQEAIARGKASHIRAEMADIIIAELKKNFFTVDQDQRGYETSDQRKAYLVKLRDISGTEVVVWIHPGEESYQNSIIINTKDAFFQDDVSIQQRAQSINKILKEAGLNISNAECEDSAMPDPIEEIFELREILKSGGKGIPQSALKKAGLNSLSGYLP